MYYYTVQQRPVRNAEPDPDVILIKEGFCWPAFVAPPLWLVYRLQVLGLLVYLSVTAVLSTAVIYSLVDPLTGLLLAIVLSFLVASLANDWRRWRLTTIGYQLVAIAVANNLRHAVENFFYSNWPNTKSVTDLETKTKNTMPANTMTPFATSFDSE